MLTEELKENTEDIHQASEKKMIFALKKIDTKEAYINLLSWLHGFYAPVEALIRRQLTEDNFPGITKRSRAEYLLWDIGESGVPAPQPDTCEQLPVIDSFSLEARGEIIAAAEDTFLTFKNWIGKHELQPQVEI
jgi:heme oxygenase